MSDIAWYPFYVGDYCKKTAHLSLLEHGAYRLLLDHYYATRQPLPNDHAKLYRICRARSPSERKAVLSVTAEFFTQDGTLMRNEKCDSEIGKQLKYSESQSAKAKLKHSYGKATAVPRARVPQSQSHNSVSKDTSLTPTPLPDWLPQDEWVAFKEMRKKIKSPMTSKAESLAINALDQLRREGCDPKQVINQSVLRGWKTFYKPKANSDETANRYASTGNQPSKTERLKAAALRVAISGGFAPQGSDGETRVSNDGISVFPDS